MKKFFTIVSLTLISLNISHPQNIDSIIISSFFSEALSDNTAYNNLRYLCK